MISTEEKNKIISAVERGKAYAYLKKADLRWGSTKEDVYVFPIIDDIEKTMLTLFDNATVYVTKNYIFLKQMIQCKNEIKYATRFSDKKIIKTFIIKNREAMEPEGICKTCEHMVKSLVGECREDKYVSDEEERYIFTVKYEINNYMKIKPGYVRPNDFSSEVDFSKKNVEERLEYYEKKGNWRKKLNKTRKNTCSTCVKYRTHTCKKGYGGHREPTECHYEKEELMQRLRKECIEDFGSLGRAFWYFNQCGKSFEYKDPITKRTSTRYISVPGNPAGTLDAKGFFMSFARYPFEIGHYGAREPNRYWRKKERGEKKHINYISEYEYKKNHTDLVIKTSYKKKYEELLLTAYAIYKHIGSTPGEGYYFYSYTNYLVYLGITAGTIRVGIGASKWNWHKELKNLNDLFNVTTFNISKK